EIAECDGFHARIRSGGHNVLAVFVQPHAELDIVSDQPVIAGNDVGRNLLEGMTDVRSAIGIVDRGSDIERFAVRHRALLSALTRMTVSGARATDARSNCIAGAGVVSWATRHGRSTGQMADTVHRLDHTPFTSARHGCVNGYP